MLKEAFQYLTEVGRASAPNIVKADAEPDHVYYIRLVDGALKKVEADPDPSKHAAFNLDPIVEIAKTHGGEAETWYSPLAVICVYGIDKRNFVTLDLNYSTQFHKLSEWWKNRPALSQQDLVNELRVTFKNSLGRAGNLIEVLKRVRFNAGQTTEGVVGHGTASLGKQITGEVTGTAAIPEYITFDFPVYSNASFKAIRGAVECALMPDPGTGTFKVIPIPGELENAVESATQAIGELLRKSLAETGVPVFFGKP